MPPIVSELFRHEPIVRVQRFFGPGHPEWFWVVSELGTPWGVVFVLALALLLWGRAEAYAVGGGVVVNALASLALNLLFEVPRPSHPSIERYEIIHIGSFPSGHVLLATLLWGVLYVRGRVPLWVPALVALLVSISRLYLGVHYLGDVLGSVLIAALLLAAYRPLWRRVESGLAKRPFRLFAWTGILAVAVIAAGLATGLLGSSPYQMEALGIVLGGVPALLLEHRFIRYTPPPGAMAALLAGIIPLALLHRLAGAPGLAMIALAMLWSVLVVPYLTQRHGGTES
ncbi:MAG TPA: phosphatase PAP2 family protein [Longimicrobium sp.]